MQRDRKGFKNRGLDTLKITEGCSVVDDVSTSSVALILLKETESLD